MIPSLLLLLAVDHSPWQASLDAHLSGTRVDYAAIGGEGLDPYLQSLATADLASMGPAEKKALWINAYNALTVDLIAENPGISSIRDLDEGNPWDARTFTVGGQQVTLNAIEHKKLRPLGDARIHAAVNCASVGCPPLPGKVFTAEGLDAQLDAASRRWVKTNAVTVGEGEVKLNQIFDWYGDDFVPKYGQAPIPGVEDPKQVAALNYCAKYADEATRQKLRAGGYTVSYAPYDWKLNRN